MTVLAIIAFTIALFTLVSAALITFPSGVQANIQLQNDSPHLEMVLHRRGLAILLWAVGAWFLAVGASLWRVPAWGRVLAILTVLLLIVISIIMAYPPQQLSLGGAAGVVVLWAFCIWAVWYLVRATVPQRS